MLNRIRQFYRAITANIKTEEIEFVNSVLNPLEQELFYQMSVVDQRHSIDVSFKIKKYLLKKGYAINSKEMQFLLKAALLHDVGKISGDLTIFDRILIVLLSRFFPCSIERWISKDKKGFINKRRHALYIALYHGVLGAQKLKQINCEPDLIEIVEKHHSPESFDWRLKLLQRADFES